MEYHTLKVNGFQMSALKLRNFLTGFLLDKNLGPEYTELIIA